jgi:hypothetical protein
VAKKLEVYCTVEGCSRSRFPTGKSKGRSFGSREDKMREHYRTVHVKNAKKKADAMEVAGEEVEHEDGTEGDCEEMQVMDIDGGFNGYEQSAGQVVGAGYEGYRRPFYAGHDLVG